jgi:hypothetical protein
MLPCFNRNHRSLEQTPAKWAGNPQQGPLEQRAIKRRSSLTVSWKHSNRKNSLAIVRKLHWYLGRPPDYRCRWRAARLPDQPQNMPTPGAGVGHEIVLAEEEISDVSMATFYIRRRALWRATCRNQIPQRPIHSQLHTCPRS